VYPLKLMMSAAFNFFSRGWFPSEFYVETAGEMCGLIVVYGFGVAVLAGALALLYWRSQSAANILKLNKLELLLTRGDTVVWSLHSAIGLLSALFALFLPERIGVYGGFVYFLLPATVPFVAIHFRKQQTALDG
jgi:hypothetical protein